MKQNIDFISVTTLPPFPKDPFIAKAEIKQWRFTSSTGKNPYPNPCVFAWSSRPSTKGSPCVSHWSCQLEPMDNGAHICSSGKPLLGVTAALCWWGIIPKLDSYTGSCSTPEVTPPYLWIKWGSMKNCFGSWTEMKRTWSFSLPWHPPWLSDRLGVNTLSRPLPVRGWHEILQMTLSYLMESSRSGLQISAGLFPKRAFPHRKAESRSLMEDTLAASLM